MGGGIRASQRGGGGYWGPLYALMYWWIGLALVIGADLAPYTTSKGDTMPRPINHIAGEIAMDWCVDGVSKVNYAAQPYLDAMFRLQSIDEDYGYDTGRSVVVYFLSNASSYRGETARKLKAELKAML